MILFTSGRSTRFLRKPTRWRSRGLDWGKQRQCLRNKERRKRKDKKRSKKRKRRRKKRRGRNWGTRWCHSRLTERCWSGRGRWAWRCSWQDSGRSNNNSLRANKSRNLKSNARTWLTNARKERKRKRSKKRNRRNSCWRSRRRRKRRSRLSWFLPTLQARRSKPLSVSAFETIILSKNSDTTKVTAGSDLAYTSNPQSPTFFATNVIPC